MKKILLIMLMVMTPAVSYAATTCTQSIGAEQAMQMTANGEVAYDVARWVKFECIGDGDPNTAMDTNSYNHIKGWKLKSVSAYPTAGGDAPDVADVFILMGSQDLLGSSDAGTTSDGNGTNLIHATLRKTTDPIFNNAVAVQHPRITGNLTLKVTNQTTVSADYTVELNFEQ